MEFNKKMIILLVSILFVMGCTGQSKDIGPSQTKYIGGTTALIASFIDGAPPEEIFDAGGMPFSIVIKLENVGEYDVQDTDGYVEIIGINPIDFNKPSQADLTKDIPVIKGARKNFESTVIPGDQVVVEFVDLNYLPNVAGNFLGARVRANLCYNYETRASANVCIKRDILQNIRTKEICELSGEKFVANSGGPIQLTSVREEPLGSEKIQISFVVDDVGDANDRFYKMDTDCDDLPTNIDRDVVYVEILSDINGVVPSCNGLRDPNPTNSAGYVTLYDGEPRRVICQVDVSGIDSVFLDEFEVKLRYRYSQFIEKPVLIKDVTTSS